MTVHIIHFSNNRAEKQKINEIKYPLLDSFYETEDVKVRDMLKIIELEEHHKDSLRLA